MLASLLYVSLHVVLFMLSFAPVVLELWYDFSLLMHMFVFSLEFLVDQDIKNRKTVYVRRWPIVFGDIKSYDHGIMHTPLWVKREYFFIKKN